MSDIITSEVRQRIADELRQAGVTEKTIKENINWDEFVFAYLRRPDEFLRWKQHKLASGEPFFGEYIRERTFVIAMTID